MSQDTPTIQDLIHQAVDTYVQDKEVQEREAKEKKNREKKDAADLLHSHLEPALSDVFRSQIILTYDHTDHNRGEGFDTFAFFHFLGEDWHLSYHSSIRGEKLWNVITRKPGNYLYTIDTKLRDIQPEHLQHLLLIEMGKQQVEVEQKEKERAKQEQEYRERDIRRERQEEEDKRRWEAQQRKEAEELAIKKAAAQGEHDRLMIKWKEAKQKAQQEMWQWPEGLTLNIYYLQYQQGSYNNHTPDEDETEAQFDYGYGWTSVCELDRGGWVTLQPTLRYSNSEETTTPRTIRLKDTIHFPIWESHTITSIADLDDVLTHKVELTVPGIAFTRNLCENGEYRLFESDPDGELAYREYLQCENIGRTPVKWIRDLADQAAKVQE